MRAPIALAAVAVLFLPSAADAAWRTARLQSTQGHAINVDYEVRTSGGGDYKPSYTHTASPLYVNVRGRGLTPSSKVRVVLNNWQHAGYPMPRNGAPQTYVLDLQPSTSAQYGFHFSGSIANAKVNQSYLDLGDGLRTPLTSAISGYGGTHVFDQTLSTVVDGHWQRDPITGTHDFGLKLGQ